MGTLVLYYLLPTKGGKPTKTQTNEPTNAFKEEVEVTYHARMRYLLYIYNTCSTTARTVRSDRFPQKLVLSTLFIFPATYIFFVLFFFA